MANDLLHTINDGILLAEIIGWFKRHWLSFKSRIIYLICIVYLMGICCTKDQNTSDRTRHGSKTMPTEVGSKSNRQERVA